MHIKPEIRVLGIDDSALIDSNVLIIGAFMRGGDQLDGVLRSHITRDGMDATDIIIQMIKGSKHYRQIRAIMLDGVTYAGFNTVDIRRLYGETGIPIIVYMRSCPDFEKIRLALDNLPEKEKRWEMIQRAGRIYMIDGENPVYIQLCGIEKERAIQIVRMTSTHGNIPEPLRLAHLIATGVVLGESTGKA